MIAVLYLTHNLYFFACNQLWTVFSFSVESSEHVAALLLENIPDNKKDLI